MYAVMGFLLRVLRCVREILSRVSGAYAREWRARRHGRESGDKWEGT